MRFGLEWPSMASTLTIDESKAFLALCRRGRLYDVEHQPGDPSRLPLPLEWRRTPNDNEAHGAEQGRLFLKALENEERDPVNAKPEQERQETDRKAALLRASHSELLKTSPSVAVAPGVVGIRGQVLQECEELRRLADE
jgi:hypothetical protein